MVMVAAGTRAIGQEEAYQGQAGKGQGVPSEGGAGYDQEGQGPSGKGLGSVGRLGGGGHRSGRVSAPTWAGQLIGT